MIKNMFFFLCFSLLISTGTFAQALTQGDTVEIQNKAQFCILQFQDILNQLAKPDDYFRTYNVDNFISKFYESTSNDQIFRDSAILIEDDLHPGSRSPTFENEKTIKRYLNDFYQFYEKSISSSVIFSNIQISDVKQGDYIYVNVSYESEFRNRHKYIDIPYTKHKKIATVKAEPTNDGWKARITFIGYYKTSTIEKEEAIILDNAVTQVQPKEEVIDEKNVKGASLRPSDDTVIKTASETDTRMKEAIFNVNDTYKRGNAFNINWNETFENPVSLRLYQGDAFKQDLASTITTSKYTGVIPKKAKPGDMYNFQLYDPATKTTLKSGGFKIRRKIPLGLQIPVYVGVGVLIYTLINSGNDGGDKDCAPNCPGSDLPDPVNPYGN